MVFARNRRMRKILFLSCLALWFRLCYVRLLSRTSMSSWVKLMFTELCIENFSTKNIRQLLSDKIRALDHSVLQSFLPLSVAVGISVVRIVFVARRHVVLLITRGQVRRPYCESPAKRPSSVVSSYVRRGRDYSL